MEQERKTVLTLLAEGYERRTWHGSNLRGSLRGVSPEEASWRPQRNRHNIWEIAVHAAYWKYAVRRRLLGEKRGSFPLEGSNWFARPQDVTVRSWKKDLSLLGQTHRDLMDAVRTCPLSVLHRTSSGSRVSNLKQVYGVAMHDVYHAGQIQLLKRMLRKG